MGRAFANKYKKNDEYVAVFFGDGAIEEGVFWESVNFACLHKLKILFVCEDNGLAIHTHAKDRQGYKDIPQALSGFHIQVGSADGADLNDVIEKTLELKKHMENGEGPGFLHIPYFRFLEHVGINEDFGAQYREQPTAEELVALDPVKNFEKYLLNNGYKDIDLAEIRLSVQKQIDQSVGKSSCCGLCCSLRIIYGCVGMISKMSFRDAISLAVRKEMAADPDVFVFGLDVPDHKKIFGSTKGILEEFGEERCLGTPLSEEAMTGVALGAALSGLRPVHIHIPSRLYVAGHEPNHQYGFQYSLYVGWKTEGSLGHSSRNWARMGTIRSTQ